MKTKTADTVTEHTSGISHEEARDCRARVWQFIFACHAKKKAARPGSLDDQLVESGEVSYVERAAT